MIFAQDIVAQVSDVFADLYSGIVESVSSITKYDLIRKHEWK